MKFYQLWIVVVPWVVWNTTALPGRAQPLSPNLIPRPILPSPSPSPNLPAPQPPPPLKIPPTLTPPTPNIPPGIQGNIRISQFKFEGNRVFSDQQLAEVVAPFTGRYITPAELRQALEAINKLYMDSGYVLSGVRIPGSLNQQRQSLENVVPTVEVVEAQVEEITILGSDRLQDYLRSRLKRAVSPALSEPRLLEALRLLQQDPLINALSAELQPGSRKDRWILNVQVTPHPPLRLQIGLDNYRSPGVGSLQRRLEFSHNNLLGLGDRLELGFFNTDGSNAGTGSYTIPFNAQDGTVQFSTNVLASRIVERPFNQLDLISNFRSYDLTVRQPLLRRATKRSTQEFAVGLTGSRQESDSSLLGVGFPLSPGANSAGETRITALRLVQEYSLLNARESLGFRSQFSVGLPLGATRNPQPPDSEFFHWQGEGQYIRLLAPDTPLLFRVGVQAAGEDLPPIEQLGLGGPDTVRGYRQDVLLANSGAFASLEVRVPLYRSTRLPGLLQIAPFVDFGTSFDSDSGITAPQNDILASVGVGLQWQMADRLFVRLDYGIPLLPQTTEGDSLQEQGFTFRFFYNPL